MSTKPIKAIECRCPWCSHSLTEHSRYIGCVTVVEPGVAGKDEEGADDRPDVFCACTEHGTLEDLEDEEE